MSDEEAKGMLRAEFVKLQAARYDDLVARLAGRQERFQVEGLSGTSYHLELEGFWDDKEQEQLRVVASLDDGGMRAFLPFTDAFTISRTGLVTDHSEP